MYLLLGICLALAAFLAVNAIASLAASFAWRALDRLTGSGSARARAEVLFAVRIAPPALALIFVGFFLLPAYVGYEPRTTSEVVSAKLAAFALSRLTSYPTTVNRTIASRSHRSRSSTTASRSLSPLFHTFSFLTRGAVTSRTRM